jgi:hypothetical protein
MAYSWLNCSFETLGRFCLTATVARHALSITCGRSLRHPDRRVCTADFALRVVDRRELKLGVQKRRTRSPGHMWHRRRVIQRRFQKIKSKIPYFCH